MPGAKAHILLLLLMAAASTAGQCQDAGMKAAKWYYQASQLFDSHTPTAETDSLALLYCNNAIQVLEHAPAHTNDLLLFQALEKKATCST